MAPQSPALRAVVKQAHGVAASATVAKPLAILGEGNITRANGDYPKGYDHGVRYRYGEAASGCVASGTGEEAVRQREGCWLAPLPLHDHPETRCAGGDTTTASGEDRSRQQDDRASRRARCHGPGNMGSGVVLPGRAGEAAAGPAAHVSPRTPSAHDSLPPRPLRQPPTRRRLASTRLGVAHQQRPDLGAAAPQVCFYCCSLPGDSPLRYSTPGESRDQWGGIPAGRTGRL